MDLQRHEGTVKDIILVAQGEMALEEFLKQVKETWNTYELDLINYQNKCRIIRGLDDLFKENISQDAAMKLSPFYKVLEEEAIAWEVLELAKNEPETGKDVQADKDGVQTVKAVDKVPEVILETSVGDRMPTDFGLIKI